jgi:hypothetical protein
MRLRFTFLPLQRFLCSVNDLCGGFVADGW